METTHEHPVETNHRVQIQEVESQYETPLYPKRDVVVSHGNGTRLYDINGKEYLDCTAGFGVANLGHCNPQILETLRTQASKIITCPEIFSSPVRAELLQRLIQVTPGNMTQVFFCNSGTEANEAAIKFAKYSTGRTDFIACMRGFHGRTQGSLSATFQPKYREPFGPLLPGFTFVPYNNIEKIREATSPNTAGIIIELVQGEGGVNPADKQYIRELREHCNENGVLLIIDEVQTGFGRTGELFASTVYEVEPDIMTLAKSIANGIPMGAVICNDKISMKPSLHGSTFGGNPLACATAITVLDIMTEPNFFDTVKEKASYFQSQLSQLDFQIIRDIRSVGMMFGIELRTRAQPYLEKLMEYGILALPAGTTVIRLLPPLTISFEEIDRVVETLRSIFTQE